MYQRLERLSHSKVHTAIRRNPQVGLVNPSVDDNSQACVDGSMVTTLLILGICHKLLLNACEMG